MPIGVEVIEFYLRFIPGPTFISHKPLSPVNQPDGPSTCDRIYFCRSRAQVFKVGRICHTIITNISMWFIVCFGDLYFAWRLGDVVC